MKLLNRVVLLSGVAIVTVACASGRISPGSQGVAIVDTHVHPGRSLHRGGWAVSASRLLRLMDEFSVAQMVLLPPPFPEGHSGAFAGGASLNPMIQRTPPDHVPPDVIRDFRAEADAIVKAGAVGFGEIALEHFSSGRGQHPYESARPDHPLLLLLADIAAERRMVIDVHMEAVPRDMPMPHGRRGRGPNPEELHANIAAFERLLDHNPAATIVWAHAGWDLTGERNLPLMRNLLGRHPNLYMSVKIDSGGSPRTRPMDPSGVVPGWLAMLRAFPDRFVIGSDQFFGEDTTRLTHVREFVDALPPDLARLVGRENALRLYRLPAR